jgi:hypothetical protein
MHYAIILAQNANILAQAVHSAREERLSSTLSGQRQPHQEWHGSAQTGDVWM